MSGRSGAVMPDDRSDTEMVPVPDTIRADYAIADQFALEHNLHSHDMIDSVASGILTTRETVRETMQPITTTNKVNSETRARRDR